jgi:hypothetical protein
MTISQKDIADAYHQNYLRYLQRCWGDHLGAIFTPDILWNSLLSELTLIVKESPETYRNLFTKSTEKQNVIIINADPVTISLNRLIDCLKDIVPTNTDIFFPEFSTSTLRSKHAFNANFADMVSPFFSYFMLACSIPAIDIRGTEADYEKIADSWQKLKTLFGPEKEYMEKVGDLLTKNCQKFKESRFLAKKSFLFKDVALEVKF